MYKKRSEFKKIAAIAVGACGIAYGFGGAEVQAAPPEGGNWTLLPASSDELMETVWMRTNGQTESGMMSQQILRFVRKMYLCEMEILYSQRKSRTITERLIRQERWNQNSMFRELQAM